MTKLSINGGAFAGYTGELVEAGEKTSKVKAASKFTRGYSFESIRDEEFITLF